MSTHQDDPGRRPYRSQRRREQAEQTRNRIAAAARRLFVDHGWAGTTIRTVAEEAGVSEPTVYATYGSKAGLVSALVDSVEDVADLERTRAALERAAEDPAAQLGVLAAFDRRLFEASGDVIGLFREAARAEPRLAGAYAEGRARAAQLRRTLFEAWPTGSLAEGISLDDAVDTALAVCNLDVFMVLTAERGWSPDRVERWWQETQVRLLLAPDASGRKEDR